jgi:peptidoglycan/xylan/chitin deacetylase (PgdA/CDA1 family)
VLGWIALAGWVAVAVAGMTVLRLFREESRADRIICLLYHRVVPRPTYDGFSGTEQIFSIPEDRFREQMHWMLETGYSFVDIEQLTEHLGSGAPLPPRPVYLSFDDGCESVFKNALPILRDLVFHSGEYHERRMTPEEMIACQEGGVSIGSHAVSHRGLNEMSEDEVLEELVRSREMLSEWVGVPVRHFAVPLNFYSRKTLDLCKRAGYSSVCTSDNGTCNRDTDPHRIKRFIIEGAYDLPAFQHSLETRFILQKRILNALKKIPPKLLGERVWMPLRQRIFGSPLGRWLTFRYLRRALLLIGALLSAGLVAISVIALI